MRSTIENFDILNSRDDVYLVFTDKKIYSCLSILYFLEDLQSIYLHIGPSSINKQEWDTLVTAMFYHFLPPEGGHPTWEDNFIEKNTKMQSPFF